MPDPWFVGVNGSVIDQLKTNCIHSRNDWTIIRRQVLGGIDQHPKYPCSYTAYSTSYIRVKKALAPPCCTHGHTRSIDNLTRSRSSPRHRTCQRIYIDVDVHNAADAPGAGENGLPGMARSNKRTTPRRLRFQVHQVGASRAQPLHHQIHDSDGEAPRE